MTAAREQNLTAPPARLPWMATLAALVAFAALFISEAGSFLLPCLGVALLATYWTNARLETSQHGWMVRLVLFAVIFVIQAARPSEESGSQMTARWALVGDLCAAEIVVQSWKRRLVGGRAPGVILLSGLVFIAASNTWDDRYIRYFAPVYLTCFALSLRSYRPQSVAAPLRSRFALSVALVFALALGAGVTAAFSTFRSELTELGARLLNEMPQQESAGISATPRLGSTFGLPGAPTRVLRLEGALENGYLRAMAFDTYKRGAWEPSRDNRSYTPVTPQELLPNAPGASVRITRLIDNNGLLFAPLNTAGMNTEGSGTVEWARDAGGPIRVDTPAPTTYTAIVGPEDFQGLFCAPPDAAQKQRMLVVPPELDARARSLALRVAGAIPDPQQKINAVVAYLMLNHAYSLRTRIGPGDPVSEFLIEKKNAHCEFFASASALMLRCVGIPSRYVVGYFAHEGEEGVTVVRQQDSHAWTESWIEGKGWVTVEATPGSGRPDETAQPVSAWRKWKERFEDAIGACRAWLSSPTGRRSVILFLVLAVAFLMFQNLRNWRRPGRRDERSSGYASSGEEIAALAAQFEALCRRQGIIFPPGRPWQEYLAGAATPADAPPFDKETAATFVREYNAARFGPQRDRETIARLREHLRQLEP